MTTQYVTALITVHGSKALLILKLTDGSEMQFRGRLYTMAQMDLFRDRIRFSAPWTECLLDLKDVDSIEHNGKCLRVLMKTGAIAYFPHNP